MDTIDALNALDTETLRAALSGPPVETLRLVRIAAEGGASDAQLILGQMLLDGYGTVRAPAEALRWFSEAARAGNVPATNMVGRCYENGWGVAVDKSRAADWYQSAADRGLDWGMYNLATALALGDGRPQDRPAALALFERAAKLGHAKSMNMVGSFHEDGWAADGNIAIAAHHYRQAAEAGDFRGQFNHARILILRGEGVEALEWIGRAVAGGNARFRRQVAEYLRLQPEPLCNSEFAACD